MSVTSLSRTPGADPVNNVTGTTRELDQKIVQEGRHIGLSIFRLRDKKNCWQAWENYKENTPHRTPRKNRRIRALERLEIRSFAWKLWISYRNYPIFQHPEVTSPHHVTSSQNAKRQNHVKTTSRHRCLLKAATAFPDSQNATGAGQLSEKAPVGHSNAFWFFDKFNLPELPVSKLFSNFLSEKVLGVAVLRELKNVLYSIGKAQKPFLSGNVW